MAKEKVYLTPFVGDGGAVKLEIREESILILVFIGLPCLLWWFGYQLYL
jgi:hypothetical protein